MSYEAFRSSTINYYDRGKDKLTSQVEIVCLCPQIGKWQDSWRDAGIVKCWYSSYKSYRFVSSCFAHFFKYLCGVSGNGLCAGAKTSESVDSPKFYALRHYYHVEDSTKVGVKLN